MRRIARTALIALGLLGAAACGSAAAEPGWPAWDRFSARFVESSGRVVDLTFDQKSTSEGQSYGLFFALVANRREQFDTILSWTSSNLAHGKLGERLPAWLWGKRDNGSWGVKDDNAASDADLWIAYTLLEAARLWQAPAYAVTGRALLAQIAAHETVAASAGGALLLPGPEGFALERGRYRVNPSYLPGFLLLNLARADPQGPWQAIWDNHLRLAPKIYAAGVAPDLVIVDSAGKVAQDSEREASGSYDAIRVYLWAGMSGRNSEPILKLLKPYGALVRELGSAPERVDPATGRATKADFSPPGYAGALLPYFRALNDEAGLTQQLDHLRMAALRAKLGQATNYYDQALILFGQGWLDGQYRFDADGKLHPRWTS